MGCLMYSADEEQYRYDTPSECIVENELRVGDTYYSHRFVKIDASFVFQGRGIEEEFLEWLNERLVDELPEDAEVQMVGDIGGEPVKDVMMQHLCHLVNVHTNIGTFWRPIGDRMEHKVDYKDVFFGDDL